MEKRNVGASGLQVSAVGLGCNNFGGRIDEAASRAVVDKALDSGITFFDTSDVYGHYSASGEVDWNGKGNSERILGKALGSRRKDVVLATKFGNQMDPAGRFRGASRWYAIHAVEASLKRLGTDWIDLYYVHKPDPATPIEETLRALEDLMRDGKIRYAGFSNFPAWRAVEAVWTARAEHLPGFIVCQDELSLLQRRNQAELLPALQTYGLGFIPYWPLAGGALTGKYRKSAPMPEEGRLTKGKRYADKFFDEKRSALIEDLIAFAEARDRTLLELAMSWLAAQPQVASIIAGATKPEQIEANVAAIGWNLTPDDLAEIDRILRARLPEAPGH